MKGRRLRRLAASDGARAGLVVLGASLLGHLGNYLFYVIAGHELGAQRFAEVSSLIALATLVYTPFSGLQATVARDVARLRSADDRSGISGYVRLLVRRVGPLIGAVVVVLGLAVPVVVHVLKLESTWIAVFAVVWIISWVVLMMAAGVVQGLERFDLVAFTLAGPQGLLRPLLLPLGLVLAGISGSMLAMIGATGVGLAVLVRPLRSTVRVRARTGVQMHPAGAVLALVGFAVMTNADQLVAKALLSPEAASTYSAAALLGKVALFAPAALAVVLLPRASAARERGADPSMEVLVTLGVTAATGLAISAVLALLPPRSCQ